MAFFLCLPARKRGTVKLNAAVNAVEGRARVRTINAEDIYNTIIEAMDRLGISRTKMRGAIIFADPNAQRFAKAYKYIPMSTQFTVERMSDGWSVRSIMRDACNHCTHIRMHLPDSVKKAVTDTLERDLSESAKKVVTNKLERGY